jgi:hypothetical protein
VLNTLKEFETDIDAGDSDAMTPDVLQIAKTKLPHNWII